MEAIKEKVSDDLRGRMIKFTYQDTNIGFTQEEMRNFKKWYQEIFRDNPDFGCSKCVNMVISKLTKYLFS